MPSDAAYPSLAESDNSQQGGLIPSCLNCGKALVVKHKERKKYCDSRCRSQYRRTINHEPPPYVGSYDQLPDHLKKFTMGDPNECWVWQGSRHKQNGYATATSVNNYKAPAYRLLYLMMVGSIPEGYQIDHICNNGPGGCVNWNHLRAVTQTENIRRGSSPQAENGRKTHCVNGHEFTPENTMPHTGGNYGRACRTCKEESQRRFRERHSKEERNRKRREHYARKRAEILATKQAWRDRKRAEAS